MSCIPLRFTLFVRLFRCRQSVGGQGRGGSLISDLYIKTFPSLFFTLKTILFYFSLCQKSKNSASCGTVLCVLLKAKICQCKHGGTWSVLPDEGNRLHLGSTITTLYSTVHYSASTTPFSAVIWFIFPHQPPLPPPQASRNYIFNFLHKSS
jgi:hypothetical protein